MATCVVCRRNQPANGLVCEGDRAAIADMLTDLPRKMNKLRTQLVPGQAGAGEKVSTSRTGSPVPARLDVLSLAGPGAGRVTAMLHPLVRRWSTTRTVQVQLPGREPEVHTITEWHQELAVDADGTPILVADDDQIGVLPPAEWLAWTVRAWREHFGHSARVAYRHSRYSGYTARATTRASNETLGVGRARRAGDRDPLADAWETRFGEPAPDDQADTDVAYLLNWFDAACDDADELDIAATAAELRSLTAELARVLGERPDQQWLGRCPATVTDTAGGSGPCGAGLWQDPHASAVQCPRCQATWAQRQLLQLAYDIRRVWPVDRRRRYRDDEVDALPVVVCPACAGPVRVEWRNVTATTDDRRWWQPVKATCANGCPDTERLI